MQRIPARTTRSIRVSAPGARRGATPARSSAGSRSNTFPGTRRRRGRLSAAARRLGPGLCDRRRDASSSATASTTWDSHRIIGVTHPDNEASQRVLMKIGPRRSSAGAATTGARFACSRRCAIRIGDRCGPTRQRHDAARVSTCLSRSPFAARSRKPGSRRSTRRCCSRTCCGRDRAWLAAHATDVLARARCRRVLRARAAGAATASPSPTSPACASSGACRCRVDPAVLIPRPETETLVELRTAQAAAGPRRSRARSRHRHRARSRSRSRTSGRARISSRPTRPNRRARGRARTTRVASALAQRRIHRTATGSTALPAGEPLRRDRQQSAVRRGRRSPSCARATCASSRRRR